MHNLKKHFISFFKVLIAVSLVYWLLSSDILHLADLRPAFEPKNALLLLALIGLSSFISSERFRLLLTTQDIHIKKRSSFALYLIGLFFNFLIPGGVGGDAAKAYYLQKTFGKTYRHAPYTVLFDRIIGLYALIVIALFAAVLEFSTLSKNLIIKELMFGLAFLFLVITLIGVLCSMSVGKSEYLKFSKKLPQWMSRFSTAIFNTFQYYFKYPKLLLVTFCFSILSQILLIIFLKTAGDVMGFGQVPLSIYFLAVPLGFVISAIPISPAGIGVGQTIFLFLFNGLLGNQSSLGPLVITIMQAFLFIISLPGAYFYITFKKQNIS